MTEPRTAAVREAIERIVENELTGLPSWRAELTGRLTNAALAALPATPRPTVARDTCGAIRECSRNRYHRGQHGGFRKLPVQLDGDDYDSIILAMKQFPTWFEETMGKVVYLHNSLNHSPCVLTGGGERQGASGRISSTTADQANREQA